jgi:hypothetical protein
MNDRTGIWAGRFIIGLLMVLSLACIIPGGFLYGWVISEELVFDAPFIELQLFGWTLGLLSSALIGVGLFIAGIALRLSDAPQARLASLILSLLALGFIILTYAIFSETYGFEGPRDMLRIGCIVYLLVVVAPPFLHWSSAPPATPSSPPPGEGAP